MSRFAWQRDLELVDPRKRQICKRACRSALFDKRWFFCKPLFKADLQVRHRVQRHISGELKRARRQTAQIHSSTHTDSQERGHTSIDHTPTLAWFLRTYVFFNPPSYLVSFWVSFDGSKGFPRLLTRTKSPGVSAMPSPVPLLAESTGLSSFGICQDGLTWV